MTHYRVKLFRQITDCGTAFSALVAEYDVEVADASESRVKQMAVEAARRRGLVVDYAEIVGAAKSST